MTASRNMPGGVAVVSPQEAAELQGDGSAALIVDVREKREFEQIRVDGAALVPLGEFVERHEALPRDRKLLMVCRSGARSMRAATFLAQQGFTDVANVEGGMIAWHGAGLPVKSGPLDPGEGDL